MGSGHGTTVTSGPKGTRRVHYGQWIIEYLASTKKEITAGFTVGGRLTQKDPGFGVSLGYMVTLMSGWSTQSDKERSHMHVTGSL